MHIDRKTVSASIATATLLLFLASLGVALALGTFLYLQHSETRAAKELLAEQLMRAKSRDQLQAEIMQGNNRFAVFPHADKRVGFVLNRGVSPTSLYAAQGDTYLINAIGLRGNDIAPKAEGVTRIALVSDSWFFGWRLTERERLQAQLTALLLKHYPGKPYEVITIAVPGWNVENEAAFLEDHFDLLQPDVLVWSINANDLWDASAVVPPGLPASRPAPGAAWVCPDTAFEWSLQPTPIVLERWQKNIALMNAISKTYHVPIIALHVDEQEPYVSMIRKIGQPSFPIVATPNTYIYDKRWPVEPGLDSHPTAWATSMIAVDVLGHLIEHGHLPAAKLSNDEKAIIANGNAASRGTPDKVEAFINSHHGIPASYNRETAGFKHPGIMSNWDACPQSRISLGRTHDANMAEISFDQVRGSGNGLICTARTQDQQSYVGQSDGDGDTLTCRVVIPEGQRSQIIDLYWQFEKFLCSGASDCFSAKFKSARVY